MSSREDEHSNWPVARIMIYAVMPGYMVQGYIIVAVTQWHEMQYSRYRVRALSHNVS